MSPEFLVRTALEVLVVLLLLGTIAGGVVLMKGFFALRQWHRNAIRPDGNVLIKCPLVPPVSVLAVAPHGDPDYIQVVRRLLGLEFNDREVIVILDGASPRAIETWADEFHLFQSYRVSGEPLSTQPVQAVYESSDPIRLVVVAKDAGGVADSLNAGVNASAAPLIAVFDPECDYEPNALLRLIVPVLEAPEETLAVCAGAPLPATSSLAGRFLGLEALRGWLGRSLAFSAWNAVVPAPGQVVLVQRDAIVRAGGWVAGPLELFLQIHGQARKAGRKFRIAFIPDPIATSRNPATMDELRQHVFREQRWIARGFGSLRAVAKGWGALGSWGLLSVFWARFLRPLFETTTYILTIIALVLRWIDLPMALLVVLVTLVSGMLISMTAVVLPELTQVRTSSPAQLSSLFLAAVPENLGYRQLRNLWLIAGFFRRA